MTGIWKVMRVKSKVCALTSIVSGIVLLAALAGCQLARADQGADQSEGTLIGVFVTTEYVDLLDFDSFISSNAGKLADSGQLNDKDLQKYQGRLYASPVTKASTSETGEPIETREYVFEGITGFACYFPEIKDEQGSYVTTLSDEAISNTQIFIDGICVQHWTHIDWRG